VRHTTVRGRGLIVLSLFRRHGFDIVDCVE
jgi:hypothetical protein